MSELTQQNTRLMYEDVYIRAAKESDRPKMLAIAEGTWDGHDYLPHVLDAWFADDKGVFRVMIYQDEVVAIGKLSSLGDGEWWLEGLRVAPSMRGRGAARIMHHYMVGQARQIADGVVRFSTAGSNEAVAKLAAETGFQLVVAYVPFEIKAQSAATKKFWQLTTDNLAQVWEWLNQSDYFEAGQRSFEFRWKWRLTNEAMLSDGLRDGHIYGWTPDGDGKTLTGLLVINPPYEDGSGETMVSVAFGDTLADLRHQFWGDVAVFAGSLGGNYVHAKVVQLPEYTDPLVDAGWEAADIRPVLYSRPIQMTTESDVQYENIPPIE